VQTYAIIYTFFKVMILYPEVQAKAQAELDTVVGNQRLPSTDDRAHLPYLNAILLELYRWHIVLPTGTSYAGHLMFISYDWSLV